MNQRGSTQNALSCRSIITDVIESLHHINMNINQNKCVSKISHSFRKYSYDFSGLFLCTNNKTQQQIILSSDCN